MNCRKAVELLIDYVAGDMPDGERQVLEQHFQCCRPCLVYMETYQATIRLTRQLPRDAPLPPELEQRLKEAWQQMQQGRG